MKTFKVGLIGCSGHSGIALNVIKDSKDLVLTAGAISHESERQNMKNILKSARSEQVSSENARVGAGNIEPKFYEDFNNLLETEELDVLIIDSIYGFHGKHAIAGAKKQIPMYCEKPVSTTIEELDELESIVIRNRIPFSAMFELKTTPTINTAKELISKGEIGEVLLAFGQKSYKRGTRPKWYNDPQLYGGTIPWVAIHAIDWTRYMTGMEYKEVTAHQDKITEEGPKAYETSGSIFYRCKDKGSCVINFDYCRPQEAPTHGDDRFRIVGTEGVLEGSLQNNKLDLIVRGKGVYNPELKEADLLFSQFIQGLKGEIPLPGPKDVFNSTRAALVAREAAESGALLKI